MPTQHPRIPVTCDDELAAALAQVQSLRGGAPVRRARLVRDLALRGAKAVVDEQAGRAEALARLAERSSATEGPFDRAVLVDVDEQAWGHDPESE